MSKVFCEKPFNHNYIHTNGKVRLCCTTSQNLPTDNQYNLFDTNKHNIQDYWNSARMREIRRKMIAGEEIKDCAKCYAQERQGVESLRGTKGMEQFIRDTLPDGTYLKSATTMQVHMGNVCNLKCKMCSQMYSHMHGLETLEIGKQDPEWLHWVREQGANVNNWTNELGIKEEWYKNEKTKLKIFEHINNNIKELVVIGGEPTLIPEFYELFDYCDQRGTLGEKDVTLVTNLTNTNHRLTKWLPKLKAWRIWASVDGVGERTEYIRYPSEWKKVLANLEFYRSIESRNKEIILSPAIQLLNIDQLDDIIKWWLDWCGGKLSKGYGFTWLATVWYPLICNPNIAPQRWRRDLADRLSRFKFDQFYDNLIGNLRKDEMPLEKRQELQKSFVTYNDRQDRFRGVTKTWRDLCPDLADEIEHEQKQ